MARVRIATAFGIWDSEVRALVVSALLFIFFFLLLSFFFYVFIVAASLLLLIFLFFLISSVCPSFLPFFLLDHLSNDSPPRAIHTN